MKDRTRVNSDTSTEGEYTCGFSPRKCRRANGKASSSSSDTVQKNGVVNSFNNEESLASRRRIANKIKPISGPMRPPINRSESQVDFFKMLDEKIANGKDLEEECKQNQEFEANNHIHRLVPPASSLISVSSVESETKQCSQVMSYKSQSPSPSPSPKSNSASKNNRASSCHKGADRNWSGDSYVAVCPSPKRNFHDSSSISMPSSRSSSSNSRQSCSANGRTHQVEVECHSNAKSVDLVDNVQSANEIPKGRAAVTDSTSDKDKVILENPCRLSNGQVHS